MTGIREIKPGTDQEKRKGSPSLRQPQANGEGTRWRGGGRVGWRSHSNEYHDELFASGIIFGF